VGFCNSLRLTTFFTENIIDQQKGDKNGSSKEKNIKIKKA